MKKPWFKGGPRDGAKKGGPKDGARTGGFKKDFSRKDAPRRDDADRPRTDAPAARRADTRFGNKRPDARPDSRRGEGEHRFDKSAPDKKHFEKRPFADKPREPRAVLPGQSATTHTPAPPPVARLNGQLLWGIHAVRAAWTNPKRHILRLLASEHGREELADALAAPVAAKRPQPEIVDKILLDRLLPAGAVHQGIVAVVEPLETRDAHDLIADLKPDDAATIVILDQVTDPHNVGAILRSAAALGARGVILQDRHAPELTGVLAKTACGAVDVLPVALETNLSRCIEQLQENGFFVVGLDERGTPITELPRHNRVALVLGAEGDGLRRLVAEHCDTLIALPTRGPIFSLNVSNAAAVALYALL